MPGAGETLEGTFSSLLAFEIPGMFPSGSIGFGERPSGRSSGAMFTAAFAFAELAFAFSGTEPHPAAVTTTKLRKIRPALYIIFHFKNSCAGLKVAPQGGRDGVPTGAGRFQAEFGRRSRRH